MDETAATLHARRLVESLEADPPEPLQGACAKGALRSLLRSLRVMGVFYEHDHYDTIPNSPEALTEVEYLSEENLKHFVESEKESFGSSGKPRQKNSDFGSGFGVNGKRSPFEDYKPNVKNSPSTVNKPKSSSTNSDKSGGIFFVKSQKPASIEEKYSNSKNSISERTSENLTSLQNRNRASDEKNGNSLSPSSSSMSSTGQPPTSSISPSNPGNYLDRCGVIQNPLASPVLQALGYCSKRCSDTNLAEQYSKLMSSRKQPRTGWRRFLSDRTYAFLVCLVLWGNFLRMLRFPFVDHGISIPMLVIPSSWFLSTVINSTWLFICCTRPQNFLLFFQRWHVLYKDPVTRGLGLRGLIPVKHSRYILAVLWGMFGLNSVSCFVISVMDNSFSDSMNQGFYVTGSRSVVGIFITNVVLTFCTFAWLGPPALIVAFCRLITKLFSEFEEVFKLHVTAAGNKFPKHLRLLRECHLAMCDTVELLDRYISVASGLIFAVAICTACFLLYVLVNNSMDYTAMGIVVFWLVSSILLVAIIVHYQGSVNTAMHSVGSSLLTIQTSNANQDQLAQLQMFLAKINGSTMGFTAFGLITVTKDLILALLSLYITYAIILLQFQ